MKARRRIGLFLTILAVPGFLALAVARPRASGCEDRCAGTWSDRSPSWSSICPGAYVDVTIDVEPGTCVAVWPHGLSCAEAQGCVVSVFRIWEGLPPNSTIAMSWGIVGGPDADWGVSSGSTGSGQQGPIFREIPCNDTQFFWSMSSGPCGISDTATASCSECSGPK